MYDDEFVCGSLGAGVVSLRPPGRLKQSCLPGISCNRETWSVSAAMNDSPVDADNKIAHSLASDPVASITCLAYIVLGYGLLLDCGGRCDPSGIRFHTIFITFIACSSFLQIVPALLCGVYRWTVCEKSIPSHDHLARLQLDRSKRNRVNLTADVDSHYDCISYLLFIDSHYDCISYLLFVRLESVKSRVSA